MAGIKYLNDLFKKQGQEFIDSLFKKQVIITEMLNGSSFAWEKSGEVQMDREKVLVQN